MELTSYQIALIGVAGAVLGTLLGVLVGHWLSNSSTLSAEKRASAFRLHESFRDVLLALERGETTIEAGLLEFLTSSFEGHRKAVYEFSFYLGWYKRRKFMEAWDGYIFHDDHKEHGFRLLNLEKYTTTGKSDDGKEKAYLLAKLNIKKIIAYAKYS